MTEEECRSFPLLGHMQGDAIRIDVVLLERVITVAFNLSSFTSLSHQRIAPMVAPLARNKWRKDAPLSFIQLS